jgi:hypothetical protein
MCAVVSYKVYELVKQFYVVTSASFVGVYLEAGSNTSTIALQVVGGNEKGTQCLGYN